MSILRTFLARLTLHATASRAAKAPGRLMHPVRDWYVVLVLFTSLVTAFLGLGAYLYLSIARGDLYVEKGEAGSGIDTIDRSVLKETTLFFDGQAAEFAELREKPPQVSNPF